ncbi:MAG: hypothetical protein V7696_18465 [Halioglobus sp.]
MTGQYKVIYSCWLLFDFGGPLLNGRDISYGFGGSDTSVCLGGDNGIGFGWDDMTVVKVGVE